MSQSPRTGGDECPRVQEQEEIDVPKSKGRRDRCPRVPGQAGWMPRAGGMDVKGRRDGCPIS